jgi:hypothetical protein
MIPQAYITEWSQQVPWQTNEQVEQDLVNRAYMNFSVEKPPTQREYSLNMEAKMQDSEFLGDTTALLRPDVPYNPQVAYEFVKTRLIERI